MNARTLAPWLLLLALALVAFGWYRSMALRRASTPGAVASEPDKHKVTPAMLRGAEAFAKRPAPPFRKADARGIERDLSAMVKEGPVVLIFIKDGCPCSESAEPYFNAIASAYEGRIPFLGVIDGDAEVASRWASAHRVPFPLLPDPEGELPRLYGATNSAFVALIDGSGRIDELWPGYSASMLAELNRRAAALAGLEARPLDPRDAPEELYSGCPYVE